MMSGEVPISLQIITMSSVGKSDIKLGLTPSRSELRNMGNGAQHYLMVSVTAPQSAGTSWRGGAAEPDMMMAR